MKLRRKASKRRNGAQRHTRRFGKARRAAFLRKRSAVFVASCELFYSPSPGIALVLYSTVEHSERLNVAFCGYVLDKDGHDRYTVESGFFGEKSPDLAVRMDTGFQLSVERERCFSAGRNCAVPSLAAFNLDV